MPALLGADRCVWCGLPAAEGDACDACIEALPWNAVACPRCAAPLPVAALCPACARRPPAFDAAWTAFVMGVPVEGAIHGLKYAARFDEARRLGRLMALRLADRVTPAPDLVIPVPLHPRQLVRRGYNQAVELARGVSRTLPITVDAHCARRVRRTQDQIGKSAVERRRNVRGAFLVERDLSGLRVALLDDVLTTGATLEALAVAAKDAGAAYVEAWAVARVP